MPGPARSAVRATSANATAYCSAPPTVGLDSSRSTWPYECPPAAAGSVRPCRRSRASSASSGADAPASSPASASTDAGTGAGSAVSPGPIGSDAWEDNA
ncbi:hypothetical protein AB0J82_14965 [Asanoa sp. NPDC049518]|uniref:hypothetical protein n=1 Tax=unclassified Asanoa TaxID=2685164 RepID=UPI003443AA1B